MSKVTQPGSSRAGAEIQVGLSADLGLLNINSILPLRTDGPEGFLVLQEIGPGIKGE